MHSKNSENKITSTMKVRPLDDQVRVTPEVIKLVKKMRKLDRKIQRVERAFEKRDAKLKEANANEEIGYEGIGYTHKPMVIINRLMKSAFATEKRLNKLGFEIT